MKYTQIPAEAFKQLQLNAGIIVDEFTPSTGVIGNIIGATSGGISASLVPSFSDWAEDVDNAPKNLKEFKKLESWEATMSGTFISVTAETIAYLIGAADVSGINVIPRNEVLDKDFKDIYFVGDYSDKNGETNGGFIAIHLINALSTGGFQIQSSDKNKGQFQFSFTGHYSSLDQTKVPFEVFIKEGTDEPVARNTKPSEES